MQSSLSTHPRHKTATSSRLLCGLLALPALASSPAPASAQALPQDTAEAIDALFRWATPQTPGCVVAIGLDGERVFHRAYGLADLENKVPMSVDTRIDVGSVVKQFVAAAVLLLVEDGRVALTDDIRAHIPELPDLGVNITVDHLLTHTSGVRDWVGLQRMTSEDADALSLILRQRRLDFAPGEAWSYSNSGYVLLKELVARVAGKPFGAFARERLFEPLGMGATEYVDDPQGQPMVALAYEKRGADWVPDMLLGDARGGGGALLSTAADLLAWNEAFAGAKLGARVAARLQEPARLNNGRRIGYGRGVFLDAKDGLAVVWHTGSAAAYKTLLARFPEQRLSIAIVANAGDSSTRMEAARQIRKLLVPGGGAADDAAPADADAGAAVDASGMAGLYFGEGNGESLRLVATGSAWSVDGGPELVPAAEGRLRCVEGVLSFRSEDAFELRLAAADVLELTSMEGEVTRYRRARPPALTAAEAQAYEGRYESDDLRAAIEVTAEGESVLGSLNGARAFPLEPVDPDTFQLSRMLLRFRRDVDGKVVGFDYSNPVLRSVPFTRVEREAPESR
jgi:CubicO group peptidase (beta-lactamase class C family)